MTEVSTHWAGEGQLLGYGESDSTGAWLKIRVTPEDLEHFRGLKGTTFDVLFANPDQPTGQLTEKKVERKNRGGKLSNAAAILCKDADFQSYAYLWYREAHGEPGDMATGEDIAIRYMRDKCGVMSRAELDSSPEAADKYRKLHEDFMVWARQNLGE